VHHDPLEAGTTSSELMRRPAAIEGLIRPAVGCPWGTGAGQSHEAPRRRPAQSACRPAIRTCHQERLHRRRVNGPEGDALAML